MRVFSGSERYFHFPCGGPKRQQVSVSKRITVTDSVTGERTMN